MAHVCQPIMAPPVAGSILHEWKSGDYELALLFVFRANNKLLDQLGDLWIRHICQAGASNLCIGSSSLDVKL